MKAATVSTAEWARLVAEDMLNPDNPHQPFVPPYVAIEVTPDGVSVMCFEHEDMEEEGGFAWGYELQTLEPAVMLSALAGHLAGQVPLCVRVTKPRG